MTSELEDAFVNITIHDDPKYNDKLYESLVNHSTQPRVDTETIIYEALRHEHPDHSIVTTRDWQNSVISFDGAYVILHPDKERLVRCMFISLGRRSAVPGIVAEEPVFEAYIVAYKEWEFTMYVIEYWASPFMRTTQQFILHKGPEQNIRELIAAAGAHAEELHNEIWVYEGSYWRKDRDLWEEVTKANWNDIILDEQFKKDLRNDVDGFYSQEKIYKELGIPWKRGMIMFGPPGNGKTITMKAIMKYCPGTPLYVRSFRHWAGPEQAMREVFSKARLEAPCLLVLEDLDALIDNSNRSFFLNQIDGLESNDGLLIIGTTNYLDRLDPALSNRPSRFDRKYDFPDPVRSERVQYCVYWREKLASNSEIDFPSSLCEVIADQTEGFSFAYLKESFVSTLVLIATGAEKAPFPDAIQKTIKQLRKQIGEVGREMAGRTQGGLRPLPGAGLKQLVGL